MAPTPDQSDIPGTANVTEKFIEILRSNGIKDAVSSVCVKDAGLKGEGFASLTQHVTVQFENPNLKPLNLFVKSYTNNASHSEMLDELKLFQKEATFLVDYVKAAKEMCRQKGHEEYIDFYPKCYYGDDKMIVLENMVVDKGYELIPREIRQDLEAARFAIKTIAKHHAISHAMIKESGGAEKFFQQFKSLDFESFNTPKHKEMMKDSYSSSINSDLRILEKSRIESAAETAEKLKSFIGKPEQDVENSLKIPEDHGLLVLGHGDYHNNNMMFLKDKQTNKIIHHVAIDFQVTRYNSPTIDLEYFLFTSLQQEVRRKHRQYLFELYVETLNKVSEDLGHPINLTYEELFSEFRKRFGYGFWVGFTIAVGPGMAIFKDFDISEIDLKDWGVHYARVMSKWIDDNPEKTDIHAQEIKRVLEEYEELKL